MSAKPYRLPESAGAGRLIDRSKPFSFTFDGRRMTGFAGDTLASAVLANGHALFGRSFKYHRPRGSWGWGRRSPMRWSAWARGSGTSRICAPPRSSCMTG
jgi:sarcosine oxidase, subunit alpha